jgi:hypothetical protein
MKMDLRFKIEKLGGDRTRKKTKKRGATTRSNIIETRAGILK